MTNTMNKEAQATKAMEFFHNVVDSVAANIAGAMASGQSTVEEYAQQCEDNANVLKGTFLNTIGELGRLTGCSGLLLDVCRVLEAGLDENTGKKDLFKMAKEVRVIVDEEIAMLEMCFCTEEADILKKAFHEDSIFNIFAKSLCWIAGKLWRKLRRLGSSIGLKVSEDSLIGGLCKGLRGLAHVVQAGAKLVVNTAKYALSIVGAGVIAIADWVLFGLLWVLSKLKGVWTKVKGMVLPIEDIELEEDSEFFEDEIPEEEN